MTNMQRSDNIAKEVEDELANRFGHVLNIKDGDFVSDSVKASRAYGNDVSDRELKLEGRDLLDFN